MHKHRWLTGYDPNFTTEARVCAKSGCGKIQYAYGNSSYEFEGWIPCGESLSRREIDYFVRWNVAMASR